MTGIKETLKVQSEGAVVGVEETLVSVKHEFSAMPTTKRMLATFFLLALIPGFLLARYGTEYVLSAQYAQKALSAHPAFSAAADPEVGVMTIIKNPTGSYSAFAEVTNPNLDLATSSLGYTAEFTSSQGELIYSTKGTLYLLPNEKKIVAFPKIEVQGDIKSGVLNLEKVAWVKKLSIPEISLRVSEPTLYDESNPLTFIAEGAFVNNSPYALSAVRLVFLLYDANNQVIGVSQRDEFRIPAFGRRAYKQLWPGLYRSDVAKVKVVAYTNTLDPQNVTVESANPLPVIDERETDINN